MAAAAALTAALIGETFTARADIQKVQGSIRDEQDAVTQVQTLAKLAAFSLLL